MSQHYTHLLIPRSTERGPAMAEVAAFVEAIVNHNYVPRDARLLFSTVERQSGRTRLIRNPTTGEVVKQPATSRRPQKSITMKDPTELIRRTPLPAEYDVLLEAVGIPESPPLEVGLWCGDTWTLAEEEYHMQVSVCVRSEPVRLYWPSEAPSGAARLPRSFGDECSPGELVGYFRHPDVDQAIAVPGGACASYWIQFEYGAWLYPQLGTEGLNLLNDEVITLARTTFGSDFVQGCAWG